ncbi:hypothetical protein [Limnohabitans sp. Jir72]|uniref:hypothetical protein n=1 Tax=Limnohabitans sp. Jir72 TaxID=1977909 RepID=UPI000D3631E4|nr:hypothetical protein [Limnohabitans sp. Jir72]PUE31360.1 hypothetical protein B9Z52_10680 [Limnohabitans sp. Jir72]
MKSLQLDFLRGQKKTNTMEWVVLAFLSIFTVSSCIYGFGLLENVKLSEAKIESMASMTAKERRKNVEFYDKPAQIAEALKIGERVSKQLNTPWDKLFSSIEFSQFKDVAVLEISPDAAASKVRISGEVRDQDALQDYTKSFWKNQNFSGAYLIRQKINDKTPENPIQFSLDLVWSGAKHE